MVYDLDKKGRDILAALSLNGRATKTRIGDLVGLSKQGVAYRIDKLEQDSIILGYHAITDVYQLGRSHQRFLLKYENMPPSEEAAFLEYLRGRDDVVWIAELDGDLDGAVVLWPEHPIEAQQIFDEIKEAYGEYFRSVRFTLATRIEYLPYTFLNGGTGDESLVFGGEAGTYDLSGMERALLNRLNKNGRATLVDLADMVDSTAKVVKGKIRGLEDEGVILGYRTRIDHAKLGYEHRKVFLDLREPTRAVKREIASYLRRHDETIFLVTPLGAYDLEFELVTESNKKFRSFMDALRGTFPDAVQHYDVTIEHFEPRAGQLTSF